MKTKRTKNKSHVEAAVKERKRQINGARFPVITDAAELGAAPSWQVWIGDWTKPPILSALLELRELVEPGQRVHVISDPPYGDATHNNMMRGQTSAQAARSAWRRKSAA